MAWGEVNVHERRVQFVVLASRREQSGQTMQELCAGFGISRQTGYRWVERYEELGVAGVVERSRRPAHTPRRTDAAVEARVEQLRRQRPDWGARKLAVLLRAEGIDLPAITIHRILLRRGLVRVEDQHRPAPERFERAAPNELWQMDFKSPTGWDQPVGPLSLLDDHSRYAVDLHGIWTTRAEPVRERLEDVFEASGVPDGLLMDHGTPWWNPAAANGWTQLRVWLMKQGIQLHFSGYRHPQTQGKVERFHGTIEAAIRRRGLPLAAERQAWLDQFREEYNHLRPHEALGMRPPASVWHKSLRRYQPNPPAWEYPLGAEVRRLGVGGQLWLGNHRWEISHALADEFVRLVRMDQRILVYYCDTLVREIDVSQGRSVAVAALLSPASA
jgi:transposase InsO family protein